MALFGLIKDKNCDICGATIKLLGNRKLEDGNCCKECASKLSPWFDERRHSTVQQIKDQIDYRERNLEEVKNFRITRTIATDRWSVLLDENAKKFLLARNPGKLTEENPDVIAFSDITGCRTDVDEDREEIKREVKEGEQTKLVSYDPPRYEYEYRFHYIINVNHPYFDEMKFDLNNSSVRISPPQGSIGGKGILGVLNAIGDAASSMTFNPRMNPEYTKYEQLGEEITQALTGAQQTVREEAAAAAAGPRLIKCPYCGAQTEIGAGGKCQYCGGYVADAQ